MKIPALRIEINGKLVAIAGAEDLAILTGQVGFGAGKGRTIENADAMFSVMGLSVQGTHPRQLTWGSGVRLKQGDRVTFEVTEVEQPSQPDQVLRTPSSDELAAAAAAEKKQKSRREPKV